MAKTSKLVTYDALFAGVERVEVIDASGRTFVEYYQSGGVTLSIQDEGRTLKLFASEPQPRTGSTK